MADSELVQRLKRSVEEWNAWRRDQERDFEPDLTRAVLNNVDLTGADLSNSRLAQAELGAATLKRCDFRGADLVDAYLVGANLEGARMAGAKVMRARLRGANLEGAAMVNADLEEAALAGASLRRANLSGANLREATLTKADLTEATLTGADLQRARLEGADMTKARLRKAILLHADLQRSVLNGASLVGAVCQSTVFIGATCTSTDLRNIDGRNADFSQAILQDADLRKADLGRAVLIGTDLASSNLEETVLREALSDATTLWPQDFDVREAVGANEAARLDAEHRPVVEEVTDDISLSLEALSAVEGLKESEAKWIAGQFTLDPNSPAFEAQRQTLADDKSLGEMLTWMESVFEEKLTDDEIEASLSEAERLREEEARLDRELRTEIQNLPEAERETLEHIDQMRRQLRDWSRELPEELVSGLLDQKVDEGGEDK
ncbi:MAG: pentapeptide repeat-containing protein [Candidatus Latescibacteria bacterium]|jgi:uncharacterized protein YjbI with pentapeptide repeats|nr:hypothetical protein [Gemmatimonadaceae bacterium]MDP6016740.1 pentapeptide repeat-containing protein [Candidatus Latescibacterota bacterium]MDP7447906.1 pentapeptide repeat-containing protein [Candidatus Latescibacterota bacterium]HJP32920.1 pentapeptide repeat-containing protein [Candidatus Latescibacterota bacterium]